MRPRRNPSYPPGTLVIWLRGTKQIHEMGKVFGPGGLPGHVRIGWIWVDARGAKKEMVSDVLESAIVREIKENRSRKNGKTWDPTHIIVSRLQDGSKREDTWLTGKFGKPTASNLAKLCNKVPAVVSAQIQRIGTGEVVATWTRARKNHHLRPGDTASGKVTVLKAMSNDRYVVSGGGLRRGRKNPPFSGKGWTEQKAWIDAAMKTPPETVSPTRAAQIIAQAKAATQWGHWSDNIERVCTPGEFHYLRNQWNTLPGDSTFIFALEKLARSNPKRKGRSNPADPKEVASTILKQMGGLSRITSMTGAKNFGYSKDEKGRPYVSFQFPNRAKGKPNAVRITLDPSDTYTVTFYRIAKYDPVQQIARFHDIYAERLKWLFERQTGLALSL